MDEYFFYIDIVGICNLRCPSCPNGNSPGVNHLTKSMPLELFEKIVEKGRSECRMTGVGLYNWAEPMLHPNIIGFVSTLRKYSVPSYISTNLNYMPKIHELVEAEPTLIIISVSGFEQQLYGLGHRGGDVEKVKKNMLELSMALDKSKSSTEILVTFHKYRDNQRDEKKMRDFAVDLGFQFRALNALMFPAEKIIDYAKGLKEFTRDDMSVVDRLNVPMDRALDYTRKYGNRLCPLLHNQITLNSSGDVALCCAVFDYSKYTITDYLSSPVDKIQELRKSNPICKDCNDLGLHAYYTYADPRLM